MNTLVRRTRRNTRTQMSEQERAEYQARANAWAERLRKALAANDQEELDRLYWEAGR